MKKRRITDFLSGVLITALIFCTAVPAFASSIQKYISVTYDNIKIVVDGNQINPTDANGNSVEPFIYNGTTYLPVRAVGEAFGKEVNWEGSSKTVYLGSYTPASEPVQTPAVPETNTAQYMSDIMEPYQKTALEYKTNANLLIGGKEYHKGYYVRCDYFDGSELTFNLEGKYSEITGVLGYYDKSECEKTISMEIYGDDKLLKSYELERDGLPQDVNLDVSGISKLKFVTYPVKANYDAYCLCDMKIQ